MKEELFVKLDKYSKENVYPFHMPGHKRNVEYVGEFLPYHIDVTEINDFDDLHHAEGILEEMQIEAADIFRAEKTFCLVNGSTVGNIAAVLATTDPGDTILVARNCHNSIHTGIELNRLKPLYVYPEIIEEYGMCGEIRVEDIRKQLLENGDIIKAVVIVSPTYEGVISDIEAIAKEVHKFNIPLIVDEAHGAHLGLDSYFLKNSNELGADIVVHSIHKTLPALTQTALMHVNGEKVNIERVKKYLRMLQSSSPSYILMAGISRCLELLTMDRIHTDMIHYIENLEFARTQLKELKYLKLIETDRYDKGKLVISTERSNITSKKLFSMLRDKYGLELEMDGISYVTAMTSIADTFIGIERLVHALIEIDRELVYRVENPECDDLEYTKSNDRQNYIDIQQKAFHEEMQIKERVESLKTKSLNIAELFVRVGQSEKPGDMESEHFYYLYPPGIPIIVPGEKITDRHQILMEAYKNRGYIVRKN